MRKKLISLILVGLGVLVLLGGIVASTALKPDSQVSLSSPTISDSSYLRLPAEVLSLVSPDVEIVAQAPGEGEVALILGRTADIVGWIGSETSYTVTGAEDWSSLSVMQAAAVAAPAADGSDDGKSLEDLAAASEESAKEEQAEAEGEPQEASVSLESDMWISYVSGPGEQKMSLKSVEPGLTLLAVSLDADAGAPTVTATWARTVTTPLLMPSLIIGILLAAMGIALAWMPGKKPAPKPAEVTTATVAEATGAESATPDHPAKSPFARNVVKSADIGEPQIAKRTGRSALFGRKEQSDDATTTPIAAIADGLADIKDASPTSAVAPVKSTTARNYFEPTQNLSSPVSSAPSVASAASIARAVAEEPNLNTAELQQLGLTRRQLREMREKREALGVPHVDQQNNKQPLKPVATSASSSTQAISETLGSVEETASRTSGSNWRAAWGVRAGSEDQPLTHELRSPAQHSSTDALKEWNTGTPQQSEPNTAGTERTSGTNSQHDARKPASWWGQDSPAEPVTRRSLHSSGSHTSAQSSATAAELAEHSEIATRNPGTRRALYSNYRAEAERLSAEGDWPVPAPTSENEQNQPKEGK